MSWAKMATTGSVVLKNYIWDNIYFIKNNKINTKIIRKLKYRNILVKYAISAFSFAELSAILLCKKVFADVTFHAAGTPRFSRITIQSQGSQGLFLDLFSKKSANFVWLSHSLLLSCHNHGFFVCYPLFCLNLFLPKLISWCISCWGCKRNYKRIFVCQRNWTTDCVGAKKVCFLSMRSSCLIRNKMTYLVSMIYVSLI